MNFKLSCLCTVLFWVNSVTMAYPSDVMPTPMPSMSTLGYLNETLDALDLIMNFFRVESNRVNLDTIIGTRVVEGTLKVLLENLAVQSPSARLPRPIMQHIRRVYKAAGDVSEMSIPYIKMNETAYYAKIGAILDKDVFALRYESRDVNPSFPVWPVSPVEQMDEEESDDCLAEIFGTMTGHQCDISSTCWGRMTKTGNSGYSLTHQILFLEIAESFGCQREMDVHLLVNDQPSLTFLQDLYCRNILEEAREISDGGYKPDSQDLFMEQIALCGLLGYREFFTSEWLEQILSWQIKPEGCYKWSEWTPHRRGSTRRLRRIKREERRVVHGCLCHKTTVAASALVQFVRFITEAWQREQL